MTSKIIKSNSQPSTSTNKPHSPLNRVLKYHIHTFLEHFWGGWLHHFPEKPVPILYILFCEFFFLLEPKPNLSWCNLRQTSPILSLVIWEKRLTPTSLQPPFRSLFLPEPPFFRLNNLSSLTYSSYDMLHSFSSVLAIRFLFCLHFVSLVELLFPQSCLRLSPWLDFGQIFFCAPHHFMA